MQDVLISQLFLLFLSGIALRLSHQATYVF